MSQTEVLRQVREHPGITAEEIAPLLDASPNTVRLALLTLYKKRDIRREGGRGKNPYRYCAEATQ